MSDEEGQYSSPEAKKSNGTTWSGSLRATPVVIATILAASIATFALALTSALQVHSAPLDESLYSYPSDFRWSVGWYIAYFTVASVISTCYALLDLTLYYFARLSPYHAALGSMVLAIGWTMQLAFWLQCDFIADYSQCQQFYLVLQNRTASLSGAIVGVDTDVTYARVALGFVLVVLYVVYLILALNAVHKKKRARQPQEDTMDEPNTTTATASNWQRVSRANNGRISAAVFYA